MSTPQEQTIKSPIIQKFSEIEPKPTDWLWPGKIPAGMLSLIVGDQDTGKSTLTLYMAATISTGGYWPTIPEVPKSRAKKGSVVILTTEDDVERTVWPRLEVAGADMTKIVTITGIEEFNAEGETVSSRHGLYNLTVDKDMLIQTMTRIKDDTGPVRLVILDPISAYIGGKNANSNSEVREFLSYLTQLADVTGAAIVGINHLNKDSQKQAAYRTLGSVAWTATSRAVWLVAKDPEDDDRRLLTQIKCNLARDKAGLAFRLVDTNVTIGNDVVIGCPKCEFEPGVIYTTADEILDLDTTRANKKKQKKRENAKLWLEEMLSKGPASANVIVGLAQQQDISKRTLDRAKSELNIVTRAVHDNEKITGWTWALKE